MNRVVSLKMSVSVLLRSLLLFVLVASCSGCGFLFGDKGMFRDRAENYRQARVEPPLKVPEGMENPAVEGNYAIPPISDQSKLETEFVVPRPEPLAEDAERESVRINKLGDQEWILIDGSPGQVWPRLRGFMDLNQLTVSRTDASNGILETAWLQPAGTDSLKERYRLRIEQGVQRGTSEVYVLQADLTAGTDQWPLQSSKPERERVMVEELAQYLADSAAGASVSMLAQQAIDSSGRVTIQQPRQGEPYLNLRLPFDRAWASLKLAVEKAGFTVEDLNRSQRILYVNYIETDPEEDKGGWFSWLFGGSDDEPVGVDYLVKMRVVSEETVIITIHRADEQPFKDGEAAKLLKLIKKYLT